MSSTNFNSLSQDRIKWKLWSKNFEVVMLENKFMLYNNPKFLWRQIAESWRIQSFHHLYTWTSPSYNKRFRCRKIIKWFIFEIRVRFRIRYRLWGLINNGRQTPSINSQVVNFGLRAVPLTNAFLLQTCHTVIHATCIKARMTYLPSLFHHVVRLRPIIIFDDAGVLRLRYLSFQLMLKNAKADTYWHR